MNRLYGAAIGSLESEMRFRMVRQGALASNVANADTPAYRRLDVSFDRELAAAQTELRGSHPRHFVAGDPQYEVSRGPRGNRPDGNGVDRDQELIRMVRNAGAFKDAATILNRIYTLRRIATTGENG